MKLYQLSFDDKHGDSRKRWAATKQKAEELKSTIAAEEWIEPKNITIRVLDVRLRKNTVVSFLNICATR